MTIPSVPEESLLFNLACETRAGCRRVFQGNPEVEAHVGDNSKVEIEVEVEGVITLLAAAAFQLQGAWVGARMAAMANDAAYTGLLRAIATDYGGVSAAALNLSVRSAVTAVDLCGAALGRLTGLNKKQHEWDAKNARKRCEPTELEDQRLGSLATAYLERVATKDWFGVEALRNEATHSLYKRGIYGAMGPVPDPPPLAFPRQLDIVHKSWGARPLDELVSRITTLADDTFRQFCTNLAGVDETQI